MPGAITWFQQAYVDTDEGFHDKENHEFKAALITGYTPAANDSDPRWGSGGGVDLSAFEAAPGGNYPAGGVVVANPTVTLVGGKSRFDLDDIAIAQDPANPSGTHLVLYNNTDPGKRALCAIELGSPSDLSQGPFAFAWNVSGASETGAAA